jgi:hypothetical protein
MYDISTQDQQVIDEELQGKLAWAETRKFEAEQLALDATRLLSCTSDRLDVYRKQGFFKRCWYSISGKNEEAQKANQRDLISMQQYAWRYISLLNERELLMAQSMITVKNNLLTLAVAEEETRKEVRRLADKVYERFVALEDRLRQVEAATNIHGWLITLDTLDYDERYTPYFRLLRIVNDFSSLKSGDWNPQELRYLQKAVKEADLPWKENISLESFIDGLIDEIEGSEYQIYKTLLGNSNGHYVPVPFILENVAVPAYTSLFNIADNYTKSSDTIDALIENLDCTHTEAIKRVLFTFIKKNGVDLSAEVPLRDLAIELLSCMSIARKLYNASKEPGNIELPRNCAIPPKSSGPISKATEIASEICAILPAWADLIGSYTTIIVVGNVSDSIDNYVADKRINISELTTYFSAKDIAEKLEIGINKVTNDLFKTYDEYEEDDEFRFSHGSFTDSFKMKATEAMKPYLESVIAIEIAGNEALGKKDSWFSYIVKGGTVGAATTLLGPIGCLGSIAANYLHIQTNKEPKKSAEDFFDETVQKSFEMYDLMLDKIKNLTVGSLCDFFSEYISFLEQSGRVEELQECLEDMKQTIEEDKNADQDNDQPTNVIRENLLSVLKKFESDHYWTLGSIPRKKLKNVRRYPVDPTDEILAIIDTTVFGSAKCGMAFGLRGLYWNNDWTTETDRTFLSWDELQKSSENISVIKNNNVFLAPYCSFDLSGCVVKPEDLIRLIQQCLVGVAQ